MTGQKVTASAPAELPQFQDARFSIAVFTMISSRPLPHCPHLPAAPASMDASALTAHGDERDAEFYLTALTYAQYLWQHGLAARAILKLDRALLADLAG